MIAVEVLKESETSGVKSYTVERTIYGIAHGAQTRVVDIGGALSEVTVRFFTSAHPLENGRVVRCEGREYRVTNATLVGMAGLRRYEMIEVNET